MSFFSFDLVGDFAFLKKNDANDLIYMTYNFIHKPAVLGILGAIIGFSGYSSSGLGKNPEYYEKFKETKLGIIPNYSKPLSKVIVGFNDSTGLSSVDSSKNANTWQIREQILVGYPEKIIYTIFIQNNGDLENQIEENIKNGKTAYPLYFGKNEFFAHYENYKRYDGSLINNGTGNIDSLVKIGFGNEKNILINSDIDKIDFESIDFSDDSQYEIFKIYENLPYDFDEFGFYKKDLFLLTNNKFDFSKLQNVYNLKSDEENLNVQFI